MLTALGCFATLSLFAITFMIIQIRRAPEGYQDSAGFHDAWKNNSPEVKDVVCIWKTAAEEDAVEYVFDRHHTA